MSELPRRLVSRLRHFIANRRRHRRVRARLSFTVGISDPRLNSNGARRLPSLDGHTHDVSSTGMALVVPAIRIGEHYLTGEDRRLRIKLELPDGPVEMLMAPIRYESLEDNQAVNGYVIGARIVEMTDSDRVKFDKYIKGLPGKQPTA